MTVTYWFLTKISANQKVIVRYNTFVFFLKIAVAYLFSTKKIKTNHRYDPF